MMPYTFGAMRGRELRVTRPARPSQGFSRDAVLQNEEWQRMPIREAWPRQRIQASPHGLFLSRDGLASLSG